MGEKLTMIISGTGVLVALYLILKNSSSAVSLIKQSGSTYSSAVKTLQGRS